MNELSVIKRIYQSVILRLAIVEGSGRQVSFGADFTNRKSSVPHGGKEGAPLRLGLLKVINFTVLENVFTGFTVRVLF